MANSRIQKNILVISPTPTHPQTAGNRTRIHALITSIQSLGHKVYFIHIAREQGDTASMRDCWGDAFFQIPYKHPRAKARFNWRTIKKKLKLESSYTYSIDEWYDPAADELIHHFCKKISFDAVIVEYIFFSKALQCFGHNVLKIIDTHDVFTNRHRRYLDQGETPTWFSTTTHEEAKALARADVIIAIQQKEAEFFSRITDRRIITVGHIVPLHAQLAANKQHGRILFVGSDNVINKRAFDYLADEIFPKVRERFPRAVLAIAGKLCNVINEREGVLKLGEMENLNSAYDSATVVVNPMPFGTGLKIKSIEALGYSKPLVTTPCGAEGLEKGIGKAFRVAATAEAFADAIVDILESAEIARVLSDNAYEFAFQWNRECLRELEDLLD